MAKKKTPLSIDSSIDITESIIKQFGNIMMNANVLKDQAPQVIKTTPQMDLMLSGGVPEGSFVVVSGPPGLGKSAMSLHIAGNAQRVPSEWGDREVFYFDIEGRLKDRDVYMNLNLDTSPEKFHLIRSTRDKIMMGEEFVEIGEKLIKHKPGCVFIFDSFSALCTKARHEGNIGDRFRDDSPLLLSAFCKRISQIIPVNKSIVIGITHRIANQGPGMSQWTEASGQKIQYQADVKIKGLFDRGWNSGNEQIGQEVHWECEKSALGPPHRKAMCRLRYKHGFDQEAEIYDLATEFGVIRTAGAWAKIDYKGEELKFNGLEKCCQELKANKDLYDYIYSKIFDDLLGGKILALEENEQEGPMVAKELVEV